MKQIIPIHIAPLQLNVCILQTVYILNSYYPNGVIQSISRNYKLHVALPDFPNTKIVLK